MESNLTALLFGLYTISLSTPVFGINKNYEPKNPNILLIMSDDMGYSDIGCYGSEIKTPNLDELAHNGLRYTQFYNSARCCPTRASLLTGLYPHQAGIGHMMNDRGTEGYRGDLNDNCLTIAQVLKTAGYSTYMTGKWHVTPLLPSPANPDKQNWPLQRGFDRFFGTIHGAGSFYDPNSLTSGNTYIAPGKDFYYTSAVSDTAVKFINQHSCDNPFFMYVAYTAAHWPLHALPEDIAKYKGVYNKGWDEIRKERYKRMIEMGIVDPRWKMSEAIPKDHQWENEEMKVWQSACMEVYAAMIDRMDQGIGQIISALKSKGQLENTLILFLQDNGACAEQWGFWNKKEFAVNPDTLKPMGPDQLQTKMQPQQTRDGKPVRSAKGVIPGAADTYIGYDISWANASNTPFRMFKHWVNEGGIATPLIAHWPAGISARGELRSQPGHLIDIMATCVGLSGANYPEEYNGKKIVPLPGISLVPSFKNKELHRKAICWEHEGNRAIREGKWKLASKSVLNNSFAFDKIDELDLKDWELYDMENDRTEMMNLADQHPEIVKKMAVEWNTWAKSADVIPKPGK
jgi:arylsulfatase